MLGDANVVLTGGTDNMSACPYAVRDIRFGIKVIRLGYRLGEVRLES